MLLFLLIVLPPAPGFTQQLTHIAASYQGELLLAIFYPYASAKNLSFRLLKPQGNELISNFGFGYDLDSDRPMRAGVLYNPNRLVWVGILAVASDLNPGAYLVEAQALTPRGLLMLQSKLQVIPRKFPSYRLQLNRNMQRLVTETSARATNESLERWDLIKESDRKMLYHSGLLEIPVKGGRPTSPFGERRTYVYHGRQTSFTIHRGYDLAAPRGTPIASSSAGQVVLAKNRRATGKTVIVAVLPGLFLQYQHMDSIYVSKDEWIHQGQIIGTVGSTGFSTGPHLHQELYVKGETVDPSLYYSRPLLDKNLILSMIGSHPSMGGGVSHSYH